MGIVQDSFKRLHYPPEVILLCVRWYLSYSLSLRNIEEMMAERGIFVDHSTLHRWILRLTPLIERKINKVRTRYYDHFHIDETYIKIKGKWNYLYRAVNLSGDTVDFKLSQKRNKKAVLSFFRKLSHHNGYPTYATIDRTGSNESVLKTIEKQLDRPVKIIQRKYSNNMIEQDHRFIKKRYKAMLGFKIFRTASIILSGIEYMHILHKKQFEVNNQKEAVPVFYELMS